MKNITGSILLFLLIIGCTTNIQKDKEAGNKALNPAAEGFDFANSDPKAIELADKIMNAMGGRQAYDYTRHISWTFFGSRRLTWDKYTGNVRIESPRDSLTYLMNVNSMQGKIARNGQEITDQVELEKLLQRGKSIWINDSYWLVMPFKLKDSGVTLKYTKEDTTTKGVKAHVLEMKFKNVGDTPQNKYEIFVDKSDNLVKQWAFYSKATNEKPGFVLPWDNYKKYGEILLSADRRPNKGPGKVEVNQELPKSVYTKF